MDSLPSLIRNSLPTTVTNENLDEFATYFSIPPDMVETRLASPGDQLILRRIDVGTCDPDFTPNELMLIASASPLADVEFDTMLGERSSFFTRVKAKYKTKPRESMVPASFAPATPLPAAASAINPLLKRVANNMPVPLARPQNKTKRLLPKKKAAP
ncbi:hypothetical protein LIER_09628 [Lithospermum erythrorhizon]|uniref:Uncharacterized protein n=1 Tax=Lithospermum erythrorhizon TaxID=34254 RepID=A0AAV3PI16_LITER